MSDNRGVTLQIINQNKDKMTSEQFWCVALVSGGLGTLILNQDDISLFLGGWAVVILALVVALWALFYIYKRHENYAELQRAFACMVEEDQDVPKGWQQPPLSFSREPLNYVFKEFLPGYGAYQIIILALSVVVCVHYL